MGVGVGGGGADRGGTVAGNADGDDDGNADADGDRMAAAGVAEGCALPPHAAMATMTAIVHAR
jgi:hypothetical protein